MKKTAIVLAGIMMVAWVQADITENFQIGGLSGSRDFGWRVAEGNGAFGLDDKHAQYTITSATDSDLKITVHLESNYAFDWDGSISTELDNTTHVAVNSGVGSSARLDGDEWIQLTVSYVDPNGSLSSLKVKEFGSYFGQVATETTVFTDASNNSHSLTGWAYNPENLVDYSTTGLDALTKDNTGTWSLTVSVDDTLGVTSSGLGGFELEYDVIPEPATLGLISMVGTGLLAVRRLFII